MPIIELQSKNELYFILTRNTKVILYFYINSSIDCNRFSNTFINETRKINNIGIIFCRINCDIFPDIQILFDVNIRKTPVLIFYKDKKIKNKLIGNHPEIFIDYCLDFAII